MGSVAIWLIIAVLALTKGIALFFLHPELHGLKIRCLVGTIAKRLVFGQSTTTPVIRAGIELQDDGFFKSNVR